MNQDFLKELGFSITVCDTAGDVVYYNDSARCVFAHHGDLIGANLKAYHQATSWDKIVSMLATGESNTYTIEKAGVHKLIHQTPWIENGTVCGMVEVSIVIPHPLRHIVRG